MTRKKTIKPDKSFVRLFYLKQIILSTESVRYLTLIQYYIYFRMKTYLLLLLTLLLSVDLPAQTIDLPEQRDETILIFTRHAEKEVNAGSDPSLNEKGLQRSMKLLSLLKDFDTIDAIYSTDYKRTKETAKPTSDYFELPIMIYNPRELDAFKDKILEGHRSEIILIVGHSNTTPALVNLVMGEQILKQFSEDDYSNLLVVKIKEGEFPELEKLTY